MARHPLLLTLVLVTLASPLLTPCNGQNLGDLVSSILGDQLKGLWRNGELELLGHYCNYRVKPTLDGWELVFIGSVTCPGWTTIRGESRTTSQSGVVNRAVEDFLKKAVAAEIITQEQANSVTTTRR